MKIDENVNGQTVKKIDAQTSKDERAPQEYSLVQPLPKPDPALRNYAEASEEIGSDKPSGNS